MTRFSRGELHDGALDLPVRWEVGEALRHGQVRPLRLQLFAVHGDGAALTVLRAEDGREQGLPAGAGDAGDPEDVPRADLQRHTGDWAGHQIGDVEDGVTVLGVHVLRLRVDLLELAADEQVDQRSAVERAGRLGGDPQPVTEDRDVVGHLEHLVQPVGDVEDADAGRRHPPDDLQQVPDLVLGKGGGRLVEHDQPGRVVDVGAQRACHGDTGLERRGQRRDRRTGVHLLEADPGEVLPHAPHRLPALDRAEARWEPGVEEDVVQHRRRTDQPEVLVDEAAPVRVGRLGGAEGDLGSVDGDPTSLVRHVVAGEDLDEGGLPRAVLPQQCVDLTVLDGQIDALEGAHPAEGLRETFSEEGRHVAVVDHPTSQSFLNWSAKSVGLSKELAISKSTSLVSSCVGSPPLPSGSKSSPCRWRNTMSIIE